LGNAAGAYTFGSRIFDGYMTQIYQQLWSGLTTTALVLSTLTVSSGYASPVVSDDRSEGNSEDSAAIAESTADVEPDAIAQFSEPEATVKVGEYQSAASAPEEEAIATILSHPFDDRFAATLYVRDIPVITFLADDAAESPTDADVKVSEPQAPAIEPSSVATASETLLDADYAGDPVWRATAVAAQINQLYRDGVDAGAISVVWDEERDRIVIQVDGNDLVAIDEFTILPDTTENVAEDALQATNRIRRLLGGADPLDEVAGLPVEEPASTAFDSIVRQVLSGMASWYGPGFHGNYSASGEVFDQNAMTAAHPSLPFGTQVRVTNLETGLSVVVRINDRGPYAYGRIIDLSAAAAHVIGLISSGVAPVDVEVLGVN
jgi:rare lipoprotein A